MMTRVRVRLDFRGHHGGHPVMFDAPVAVIVAASVEDVIPACTAAEQALADGHYIAGWVAYDAAPAFEPAHRVRAVPAHALGFPLVAFGVYRQRCDAPPLDEPLSTRLTSVTWHPDVDRAAYHAGIAAVREAIARGDTYQINYTFRLLAEMDATLVPHLYAHLQRAESAPYAACIEYGDWSVLSLSPELFFHRDAAGITMRPMKGTAARAPWPDADEAQRATLAASRKNQAENVMIVDLCRNDLSRVCEVGSVQVPSLFAVERYATVWQMISTVTATPTAGRGLTDLFRALFPSGSVTGAPKASSMGLIADLEASARGLYCGAIGYAAPDGTATFNVAIRTLLHHRPTRRAVYGVGGGITWDSQAEDEHREAMQKAACLSLRTPFALVETFRWEHGASLRLHRHLARLARSAEYFGLPCDPDEVLAAIDDALGCATRTPARRVRVTMDRDGRVGVTVTPLPRTLVPQSFSYAETPVDERDVRLFHKTTDRDIYDGHRRTRPDVFDVLLWNTRGELTEFTRGNLVVELDGQRVTPPVSCGLLAGVFRQQLLEEGVVRESPITCDDLARVTRYWFINSLRGWIEVVNADTTADPRQNTRPSPQTPPA
jgi:para-aminobenzoate synthetase/4-amino-4-deoxychorismate lyase